MSYVLLDGTWSVECPGAGAYEWDNASGNIYRVGSYADVRNHYNASVASGFLDYVGRLTPGYSFGEQLSPIHTLVVSAGLRAGR